MIRGQLDDDIKRRSAVWKTALAFEIIQSETAGAEANRPFDLTLSEIESWVDDARWR